MADRVWRVGAWNSDLGDQVHKYTSHRPEQSASVELWRLGKILVGSDLEDDPAVAAEFSKFSASLTASKLASAVKMFNKSELLSGKGAYCTLSLDTEPLRG